MVRSKSFKDSKEDVRIVFYDRYASACESQWILNKDIEEKHNELLQKFSNWKITHKYLDCGFSGTQINNRPSLTKIMQDAERGEFNLLVVQNISRIARNIAMVLEIVNKLKAYGVEVYFADEGIWSFSNDFLKCQKIIMSLAEEESKKVKERISFGLRYRGKLNI